MLRVCGSRGGFKGQSESEWNNGNRLKYVDAGMLILPLEGTIKLTPDMEQLGHLR